MRTHPAGQTEPALRRRRDGWAARSSHVGRRAPRCSWRLVLLFLCLAPTALAGTVGLSDLPVLQATKPDTRGGMVLDDKYTWIADHGNGLWRVERCTGLGAGDVSAADGGAWDLWWYDPYGNYPSDPDGGSPAGYYIYEAAADGTVYVFRTSAPATPVASVKTGGGVAYGVYATEPALHTLYVATTGGLKVYDITDPANPVPKVGGQLVGGTLLPALDFSTVRGIPGPAVRLRQLVHRQRDLRRRRRPRTPSSRR